MKRLKKARTSYGTKVDRLSNLPDQLIFHILSLMDTKFAVQTCILAKVWRYHWTHIHSINLDYQSFNRWIDFRKFVIRVFRYRQESILCKLSYCGRVSLWDRIFRYARQHNLKEISIYNYCHKTYGRVKTLKLYLCRLSNIINPSGFASLTTLRLQDVSSCHLNIFTSFMNLKNLYLVNGWFDRTKTFKISSPGLVNITITNMRYRYKGEGLKLVILAPRLRSFSYKGKYAQVLGLNESPLLENVNIDADNRNNSESNCAKKLANLASGHLSIKSLKVSLNCCKKHSLFLRSCSDGNPTVLVVQEPRSYFVIKKNFARDGIWAKLLVLQLRQSNCIGREN